MTEEDLRSWAGYRLDDLAGGHVGRVEGAYLAESGGGPDWLLARMGRFGHYCLVPAKDAVAVTGHVWVPYSRERIRAAPRIDPGSELTSEGQRELGLHYGVAGAAAAGEGEPGAVVARPSAPP
jgi:hypothetical protein